MRTLWALALVQLFLAVGFGGIAVWGPVSWSAEDQARFIPRAFPDEEIKKLEAVPDLPVNGRVIRSWINYRDDTIASLIEIVSILTKLTKDLAGWAAIGFFMCFLAVVNIIRKSGRVPNGL